MTANELYEECFAQVWPRLKSLFAEKEVVINLAYGKGHDRAVDADLALVHRVMEIVFRCALTQTLRGTEIKLVVGSIDSNFALSIRDHGPGMEEHQYDELYSAQKLRELGVSCKLKSNKFSDFPQDHGTSVRIVFN
ncbi:MAG: hypothetical protein COW01_04570 [Bdellovibrionales bacterium CG12_big_fil_rev_8_21_14_0_65_38_15]|nr:MAG: hypothetical protein COW79_11890 [Bdellovibrionales bacterium CG22_combo_CG10-13_8_21_14_all_38_13]PIQ56332.1 MAG: hypothetical protein COW01_04570 [Bdellovibrionales bacterium CG12_big_fil_rev_8_21_14_0_65_38_15]PIR29363.1 MAG: hypothetical protein COV38_11505 [Bdellovibrionales bacterium CG11_big_fil_rev_8_21_14_0_20_38_13]